jgi:hypothetical protein
MLYKKGRYFSTLFFYLKIFINIFVKKGNMSKTKVFLDYTTEFNDFEKKILKQIHRMYKNKDIMKFKVWDVAIDFIENFDLGYKEAYDLANTYYYSKERLFREYIPNRKVSANSNIFFNKLSDFIESFFSSDSSKFENIDIKFKGDEKGYIDMGVKVESAYNGFWINLEPTEEMREYYGWRYLEERNVRAFIRLYKIGLDGEKNTQYFYGNEIFEHIDQNKYLVETEIKYGYGEDEKDILFNQYFNYPEKYTLKSIFDTFRHIINTTLSEVQKKTLNVDPLDLV